MTRKLRLICLALTSTTLFFGCSKETEVADDSDGASGGSSAGDGDSGSSGGADPGGSSGGTTSTGGSASGGASSGGTSSGGMSMGGFAGDGACADGDSDGVCDTVDACDGHPDAADADGDSVPDGCDICSGHADGADADSDSVPDGCDTCPGHSDAADADGDTIPDGCDQCPGSDDRIDLDDNKVPDCLENLLSNFSFDANVTDWEVGSASSIEFGASDASNSAESGSLVFINTGGNGFARNAFQTLNLLPASEDSQMVTLAAQYNVPPGQEMGDVYLRLDYYASGCSGATGIAYDPPAIIAIDEWGTLVAKDTIPAGVTCITYRFYARRTNPTVGADFRVWLDNALLTLCPDANEDLVCDTE